MPIPPPLFHCFGRSAASIGFKFRLARKDPSGNCSNGITRHYMPSLLNDPQTGAVQAVGVWDQACVT